MKLIKETRNVNMAKYRFDQIFSNFHYMKPMIPKDSVHHVLHHWKVQLAMSKLQYINS